MSDLLSDLSERPNIARPRWDQSEFSGRFRHFFTTANPINLLATQKQLEEARRIVTDYSEGRFNDSLSVEELWQAKHLYDATFHPDTGEKMFVVGRMSSQLPGNLAIGLGMLTFYKSFSGVVFWQFINQSFNACVNYTNRSGASQISDRTLLSSFCAATGGAVTASVGLNQMAKRMGPLAARLVPFGAICVANMINIPMMRRNEFETGIEVEDENGHKLGSSLAVPYRAITQTLIGRIVIAAPAFALPPVVVNYLEGLSRYKPYKATLSPLVTLTLVGLNLLFAVPLGCAMFPQMTPIKVSKLEPELQEKINEMDNPPEVVYYNRGL